MNPVLKALSLAAILTAGACRVGKDGSPPALAARTAFEQALADTQAAGVDPETMHEYRRLIEVVEASAAGDSLKAGGTEIYWRPTPEFVDKELMTMVVDAQRTLATLGYGTLFTGEIDDGTRDATLSYEAARQLPETGNPLTPITWQQLKKDEAALHPQPYGPSKYVYWSNSWVQAQGVLVTPDEERVMAPLMGITVDCRRESDLRLSPGYRMGMTCRVVTATTDLNIHVEDYRVQSWDQTELRAVNDFPCARYTLIINGVQESLEETRTTLSTAGECAHMSRETLHSRLEGRLERMEKEPDTWPLYRWGPRVKDRPRS